MLGQETAGLFAVAGGCFGFRPVIFVYIKGNTFMNSSILLWQIVVIFIIRIEIFQLTTVDFDTQLRGILIAGQIKLIKSIGDTFWYRILVL